MARYDDDDDDDDDDDYDDRPRRDRFRDRRPPPSATNPVAIAALILGICGMVAWCVPLCGVPVNLIGIILGGVAVSNPAQRGMSITGLILSVIGMILALVNAVAGAIMFSQKGGF